MKYAVLVMVAVMACGPSFSDIRKLRGKTYAMDAPQLMQVAMNAANELYGIGAVDLPHRTFVTEWVVTGDRGGHCGRGLWEITAHATDSGRSFVTITPHAQSSSTVCSVSRTGGTWTPTWVDAPAGSWPELETGSNKLALAIDERASRISKN